jgi:O-methyltransferase
VRNIILKVYAFVKGILLLIRPHLYLGWLRRFLLTTYNVISLSKWVSQQDKKDIYNDFYSPFRKYSKRYDLYEYVLHKINLENEAIDYLEFGVCEGHSFRWWLSKCTNPQSRFYGFDTFEGLPEKWGPYQKGEMFSHMPEINDDRGKFIKGLFQDTLPDFILNNNLNNGKRKLIHLDADLFSSTLFTLGTLAPYLKKGDILIFDEFNVPNHEFFAFKMFADAYYLKTRLLGAVNNYFQTILIIE